MYERREWISEKVLYMDGRNNCIVNLIHSVEKEMNTYNYKTSMSKQWDMLLQNI